MGVVELNKLLDKNIIELNAEMKEYSTFNIGGRVLAVIKPRNQEELIKAKFVCEQLNFKHQVIGNGSNVLFKSKTTRMIFIVTKFMKPEFKIKGDFVTVSCGTLFCDFMEFLIKNGFSGLEELYGIPATVGGMVMMNAGAFGKQVFDYLESVEVLNDGKVEQLNKSDITYAYHHTDLLKTNKIILRATFKLERLAPSVIKSKCKDIYLNRAKKQPKGYSLGSVFKMTKENLPAGLLIDKAGLKGLNVNDAEISLKHANFIINKKNATDFDVKQLVKIVKQKVKEKFNITLTREIEYIGDRDEIYRWLSYAYQIFKIWAW